MGRGSRHFVTPAEFVPLSEQLPWQALRRLVVDSVRSPHSRRAYGFALDEFFGWYRAAERGPFRKALVQEYRAHLEKESLSPSTINVRLAAIRKLAQEAGDNALLAPELAAGIAKVKGAPRRGVRIGNWLEQPQARKLLRAPTGAGKKAIRDRAVLGLLIGCALRRTELVRLQVDEVQQRVGRWVLPDLIGKGGRVRTVPIPAWVKLLLDQWLTAAAIQSGPLFRSVNKGDVVSPHGFTENAVWGIVREYAADLDLGKSGTPRSPQNLRAPLPRVRRGPRANPTAARSCLRSDHYELLGNKAESCRGRE